MSTISKPVLAAAAAIALMAGAAHAGRLRLHATPAYTPTALAFLSHLTHPVPLSDQACFGAYFAAMAPELPGMSYLQIGPYRQEAANIDIMHMTTPKTVWSGMTYVPGQGYRGDGVAGYGSTGIFPNLDPNISQNSAGVGAFDISSDVQASNWLTGSSGGGPVLMVRGSDGSHMGAEINSNVAVQWTPNSPTGYIAVDRVDSANALWTKDSYHGSVASASTGVPTGQMLICRLGNFGSSYCKLTEAEVDIGKGRSAADRQVISTATSDLFVCLGDYLPNPLPFYANYEGTVRQYERRTDIPSSTIVRLVAQPWKFYPSTGNSTSVGSQGTQGGSIATPTPPAVSLYTGMQFNQTTAPGSNANQDGVRGVGTSTLVGSTLIDIWPARERAYLGTQLGETHITSMLAYLSWRHDALGDPSDIYIGRSHGAAGHQILDVEPGTQPYADGVIEATQLVTIAADYGQTIVVPSIEVANGHQDRTLNTPRATFLADLNTLTAAYNTDYLAITHQTSPIVMFVTQLDARSSTTPQAGSDVQLAQVDFGRQNALGRISTPRYLFPHDNDCPPAPNYCGDGDHFSPEGYDRQGEYMAKARLWEEGYAAGTNPYPWAALGTWISATRSGNTISIQYFHDQARAYPWGGLNWNTGGLVESLAPTYGFNFDDDAHDATVASAAITTTSVANDTVILTLTATPASTNMYWGYAWVGPGSAIHSASWGNLADSDTTPSRSFAGALVNFAIADKEPIN